MNLCIKKCMSETPLRIADALSVNGLSTSTTPSFDERLALILHGHGVCAVGGGGLEAGTIGDDFSGNMFDGFVDVLAVLSAGATKSEPVRVGDDFALGHLGRVVGQVYFVAKQYFPARLAGVVAEVLYPAIQA